MAERATPRDIGDRTHEFAVRVVRLVNALHKTVAGATMARQLVRSGTSVGANAHEARGASSRKEYGRRMKIARSEAQESLYWLRLIGDAEWMDRKRPEPLIGEADEIVRILAAIGKKTEKD